MNQNQEVEQAIILFFFTDIQILMERDPLSDLNM